MATVVEAVSQSCIIRYRDAHGFLQELRVSRADARALRAIRAASRREQERWRARHVTFSDLEIDPGEIGTEPRPRIDLGYPWEGPRFTFTWLIGESRVWNGEPILEVEGQRYCTLCWDQPLPIEAACLGCDATGRDRDIRPPSEADLALRRIQRPKRDDGLNGGLEGKH